VPLSTPISDALTIVERIRSTGAKVYVTAIIVVLIGGLVQVSSADGATIPLVARVQAEQMRRPVGASNVKDGRAINGYAVKMTKSNTSLIKTVSLSGNVKSLTVRARGTKYKGDWPRMIVRIDGRTVLPLTAVTYPGWHTYSVKASVARGTHVLSITRLYSRFNYRYLYVDATYLYGATTPAPKSGPTGTVIGNAFTTGYGWPDNSPPGNAISDPVMHQGAGGTGTYVNPITIAVGYMGSVHDYPAGTRFYIPNVRKYFITEDTCAACHNRPAGVSTWVDMWVGGNGSNNAGVLACENKLTGNHTIIRNPDAKRVVVSGSLFNSTTGTCAAQFGG
jgi:Ca-dependent carbohydrate-binding module xylan-binding